MGCGLWAVSEALVSDGYDLDVSSALWGPGGLGDWLLNLDSSCILAKRYGGESRALEGIPSIVDAHTRVQGVTDTTAYGLSRIQRLPCSIADTGRMHCLPLGHAVQAISQYEGRREEKPSLE